jgi:hypothetical protein
MLRVGTNLGGASETMQYQAIQPGEEVKDR